MQTASANFAAAVSASSGVWATPQVHADWANDGYGGDNSIDDLSPLHGRPIVVNQSLDDGMPSDVSVTSGKDPTSKVTFPVGGKVVSGVWLTGPQYWSVDNTSSPISAYDRDVAALTVSHGLVTAGGIERVVVFTGQMADAPVSGRAATVDGVSKTRLAMTKTVQPAPIIGDWLGLEATWPVSWTLAQCGIYVSPPPRTGCRLWIPMHGSIQPFLPNTPRKSLYTTVADVTFTTGISRPSFVDGPYLAGANLGRSITVPFRLSWPNVPLAPGADLLSKSANAGRIEFWVRGDTTDSSVGATPSALADLFIYPVGSSPTPTAWCGIDLNRHVFMRIDDAAGHVVTLTATATLPTDGRWYFIGGAWDIANKKLWVVNNFGGSNVVETLAASTLVTTSLPAAETYNPDAYDAIGLAPTGQVQLTVHLPMAELHLTSGAQANPDNFVWLNDAGYAWTAGAVISRSQLQLFALAEPKPREAWEFVNSFAQAELAMVRTDELDRFCYFPMSYWAQTAQQTVGDAWSTTVNVGREFAVVKDPTKIRNQVTVTYTDSRHGSIDVLQGSVYADFTQRVLPANSTIVVTFHFGAPVISVEYLADPFLLIDDLTTGDPPARNFLSANTASDASGAYATTGQIIANITRFDAGSCDVTIQNTTGTLFYTIHPSEQYINISGTFLIQTPTASVTVNDTASQSARGIRGMSVNLPAITDKATATTIANELLARSRLARKVLTVTLRGDPRRQPGDLVTFTDPNNTQLGGQWRAMSIDHNIDGSNAAQDVTAAQAWPVAVWDQTTWDNSIWGP